MNNFQVNPIKLSSLDQLRNLTCPSSILLLAIPNPLLPSNIWYQIHILVVSAPNSIWILSFPTIISPVSSDVSEP